MLCLQGAELAIDCNQCVGAKALWNLVGVKLTLKSKDIFLPQKEVDTSALRFKSEQAMLCLQGAELAIDCNQCVGAKAPWNLVGVKLTLNSKDNLQPRRGGDCPHLDYNKARTKSLFFLRFLCFFIYIAPEKR